MDAAEFLRLQNTVANLSDFQGGQELLQQQETELQRSSRASEEAAREYQRIRALRQKGQRQPKKKEVKVTARIAEGDLQQKARQARQFLLDKHQVRITLQLRGRERLSPQLHAGILLQLQQLLQDVAHAAAKPQVKGPASVLVLLLQPRRHPTKPKKQQQQQQQQQWGAETAAEEDAERGPTPQDSSATS